MEPFCNSSASHKAASSFNPIIEEMFNTRDDCVEGLVKVLVKESKAEVARSRGCDFDADDDGGEAESSVSVASVEVSSSRSVSSDVWFFFTQIKEEGKTVEFKAVLSQLGRGVRVLGWFGGVGREGRSLETVAADQTWYLVLLGHCRAEVPSSSF